MQIQNGITYCIDFTKTKTNTQKKRRMNFNLKCER